MPIYQDKICEGFCERFTKPCTYPILYVQVAERFGAIPVNPKGELEVDGRKVPWNFWTLGFDDPEKEKAAKEALREHFLDLDPTDNEPLAKIQAQAWFNELPCHLECPVMHVGDAPGEEEE